MIIPLVWVGTIGIMCLLWPIFAANERERSTVRELNQDEKAAWGLYRIEDKAKVARLKHTREYDKRLWELNLLHAKAVKTWRAASDPLLCLGRRNGGSVMTESILLEAEGLVNGERAQKYGHPRENWARTATIASAITGLDLQAEDLVLIMFAVKLARLAKTPDHRDSMVDLAGYAWVLDQLANG